MVTTMQTDCYVTYYLLFIYIYIYLIYSNFDYLGKIGQVFFKMWQLIETWHFP